MAAIQYIVEAPEGVTRIEISEIKLDDMTPGTRLEVTSSRSDLEVTLKHRACSSSGGLSVLNGGNKLLKYGTTASFILEDNLWVEEVEEITDNEYGFASSTKIGHVQIGEGIDVNEEGVISVNAKPATKSELGQVQVGEGFTVKADGLLSFNNEQKRECAEHPLADKTKHGVVRISKGIQVDKNGIISVKRCKGKGEPEKPKSSKPSCALRNVIVSGREKNGLPAYIVPGYGEFLDMRHELGQKKGATGEIEWSSHYSNCTATAVLANQHSYSGLYWSTASNTRNGSIIYNFEKAHCLVGAAIRWGYPNAEAKSFTIKGFNPLTQDWDILYDEPNNKRFGPDQRGNTGKPFERHYWFTHNAVKHTKIQIECNGTHGHPSLIITSMRLFESAVSSPIDKFDAALVASPEQPFKALIACGDNGNHSVEIEHDVLISGHNLAEMSRNHIYLVPEAKDGSCPSYMNPEKAVHVPEAKAYLARDLRKVNYCTQEALKKQCLAALQCKEATDRVTGTAETLMVGSGGWRHTISAGSLNITTAEAYRGASASYGFLNGVNWIGHNYDLQTTATEPMGQAYPGSRDFTIELDFKYTGPAPETSDSAFNLVDLGSNNGLTGWAFYYYNSRGQITANFNHKIHYVIPFAADDNWHTLSVSKRHDKMFFHVDGKCLGFYDACPNFPAYYNRWQVGHTFAGANIWRGYLNNFRYIIGDCLRQNEDYVVPELFNESVIPDKTLWWNARKGVVQEWQAESESWLDTPMLPVGHIDTGDQEHLHSEAPRGAQGSYEVQAVKQFTCSAQDNGIAASFILNFSNGGGAPYVASANAIEHWVMLELEKPMSFQEVRLIDVHASRWYEAVRMFKWQASHDMENWDTILDYPAQDTGGAYSFGQLHFNGNVHNVGGMKRYPYAEDTAYKYYRILFTPIAVPNRQQYCCRIRLPLRNAKPEITECTSYVIGCTFNYGPVMLRTGSAYWFNVPFGGAEFELDGYLVERNDWQSKKRKIGQQTSYISCWRIHGDMIYSGEDVAVIATSNDSISPVGVSLGNTPPVNTSSSEADLTLICRRRY